MKKTSRRKFGKQITGALATLPAVILATGNDAVAQQPTPSPSPTPVQPGGTVSTRSSHNTPPEILIGEGSLNIESSVPLTESGSGTGPFTYSTSTKPKIGHVRLLQDNGDRLYEDLEADTKRIAIILEDDAAAPDPGQITIESTSTTPPQFVITSQKRLDSPPAVPPAAKRRFKYGHPVGVGRRIRIKRIEITNSMDMMTAFTAPPPKPPLNEFIPHEFRVLIWRHS